MISALDERGRSYAWNYALQRGYLTSEQINEAREFAAAARKREAAPVEVWQQDRVDEDELNERRRATRRPPEGDEAA